MPYGRQRCDQRGNSMRCTEGMESEPQPGDSASPSPNGGGRKVVGRPFQKGVSGNPLGRPRIEPRVRRYARRYDRRAVRELFVIGTDPTAPHDVRRRALMDLIAVGSGRPALVQEVSGRNGAPVGALVNMTFNGAGPSMAGCTPAEIYNAMAAGALEADPQHPAFRPAIEVQPAAAEGSAE